MAQGAAAPSLDGLVKLADWANVSLDELVGRGNRRIAAADSAPTTAISTYLRGRKDLTSANTKVLEAIITAAYDQLRKQQVEDG